MPYVSRCKQDKNKKHDPPCLAQQGFRHFLPCAGSCRRPRRFSALGLRSIRSIAASSPDSNQPPMDRKLRHDAFGTCPHSYATIGYWVDDHSTHHTYLVPSERLHARLSFFAGCRPFFAHGSLLLPASFLVHQVYSTLEETQFEHIDSVSGSNKKATYTWKVHRQFFRMGLHHRLLSFQNTSCSRLNSNATPELLAVCAHLTWKIATKAFRLYT